jgi:hypothetical protein
MPEMLQDRIALDRSVSSRTIDEAGHMRVVGSTLSLANVCPYVGREIPDFEKLGLDPNKIYQLYRDPASLEAAAATGNGKPLTLVHRPQTAADHDHEIVVGSIDNLKWNDPALTGDLSIWSQEGIDVVESGEQKDLSLGYYYVPVMEAGTAPDGTRFHGRMTQASINHCTLVPEGRVQGAFVGDSAHVPTTKPEIAPMATKALSRQALLVSGALRAYLQTKMASDAKFDLSPVVAKVTGKAWKSDKPKMKVVLDAAVKSGKLKLAADADITDVIELLDQLDDAVEEVAEETPGANPDTDIPAVDTDAEMMDRLKEVLKAKGMSDEDIDAVLAAMKPEVDAPTAAASAAADIDKDKPVGITKAAMDSAIAVASRIAASNAETATIARLRAITAAERDVKPFIGEIAIAQDNAPAVYKLALDHMGVDLAGVPEAAYGAVLKAMPKPGDVKPAARPAMDAAGATARATRFPNASRLAT